MSYGHLCTLCSRVWADWYCVKVTCGEMDAFCGTCKPRRDNGTKWWYVDEDDFEEYVNQVRNGVYNGQ